MLLLIGRLTLLNYFFLINLFIYFWLRWVFVAARRLSLVAASGGYSSLRCTGLAVPQHVGSSRTRALIRVPCIGRQILNHCATREALCCSFCSYICIQKGTLNSTDFLKIFLSNERKYTNKESKNIQAHCKNSVIQIRGNSVD